MKPEDLTPGCLYQGTQFKRRSPIFYTGHTGTHLGYTVWRFETPERTFDLFQNEVEDLQNAVPEEGEMGRENRTFRVTGEMDSTPAGIEEVPVPKAFIPLPRTDETSRVIRQLTWEGLQKR